VEKNYLILLSIMGESIAVEFQFHILSSLLFTHVLPSSVLLYSLLK